MVETHTLEHIADTMRNEKAHGRAAWLLIGAGCSVKANIPSAAGFINVIKEKYRSAYDQVTEKSYKGYMGKLSPNQRKDLIGDYVRKAKINWAHVAIACLMQEGYVDKVLTTNFDPLVVRACALLNFFPAVYDIPQSSNFDFDELADKAVVHLHGQVSGLILNTEDELINQRGEDGSLFDRLAKTSPGIVVGYSGDNDPVFNLLADRRRFSHGLFWVGYEDHAPAQHVQDDLLDKVGDACLVEGYDADGFFVRLAQDLEIFPPRLLSKPFSHLLAQFDELTEFDLSGVTRDSGIVLSARSRIEKAVEKIEPETPEVRIESLYMARDFEGAYKFYQETLKGDEKPGPEVNKYAAWSVNNWGNAFYNQAKEEKGAAANRLFVSAAKKYEAALAIEDDDHRVLTNWGSALAGQAGTKKGVKAFDLWASAIDKYAAALKIEGGEHLALKNWGHALAGQARTKTGAEAFDLWASVIEKYAAALKIEGDDHEVLNSWVNALIGQARTKKGAEATELFEAAIEKCTCVEKLKPGKAAYNLACIHALTDRRNDCLEWLEASLGAGYLPPLSHINEDPDLDTVRDEPWFQEFLVKAFPDEFNGGEAA